MDNDNEPSGVSNNKLRHIDGNETKHENEKIQVSSTECADNSLATDREAAVSDERLVGVTVADDAGKECLEHDSMESTGNVDSSSTSFKKRIRWGNYRRSESDVSPAPSDFEADADSQVHDRNSSYAVIRSDVSGSEDNQNSEQPTGGASSSMLMDDITIPLTSENNSIESGEQSSRHWLFGLLGSPDATDDTSREGMSSRSESRIDDVRQEDLEKFLPRDSWQLARELRNREICLAKVGVNSFNRRCVGSVNFVRRLQLKQRLEKHEGCVNALHFNQSGTLLASGSDDLNVVLWDWQRDRSHLVFDTGHRANVFQVKFVPYTGDTHLVTCARDGQVRLAELSVTGVCKSTKKLLQHRGSAHKLALQEDTSHLLYSCGEDGAVFEVDLRRDKQAKLLVVTQGEGKIPLYSIHCHPYKSTEFSVGGRDQFVRIYDRRMIGEQEGSSNGLLKKFCPELLVNSDNKANVTCAVYSHDGTEILATYNDEDIYLFDSSHSDGASHIHRYHGHRNNATVKGVNFYGLNSEFIVSGSDCSNVFLWEKHSEKIVQYFHADDGGVVNVLEPHPSSAVLATSGLDHDVKIWEPTATEPSQLKGLASIMRTNLKDRADDRISSGDMVDSQLLWFLMRHLHRRQRQLRRSDREQGASDDDTTTDSESDDDDSEEDDSGDGRVVTIPWNQLFALP